MNFFTCLALLFIGLKVASVITWSWWLVLLPLYGPVVSIIVAGIIATLLSGR